ncbi:TraX family protein [Pelotomaculum propionicicum]|mgnify:CR=1 FL=1|uniref:TraX protein n=1 Tax=Pelotomaculum propionicicum TaxID=258475 RepID=A0A4Y7RPG8_9FIRM|nr:hypothetical protein [Peptococcaceae bacterium]TEB10904.1 hypothetical protein Pmgp_02071 [Pelotomaculum propionicicum]
MSSFMLKILALLFMLIDHIGVFIPDLPIYLHWIGRLSAPIFIFCSTWGFTYTSSKKKYLIRLYVAGLVMAIIQVCINIENNFFRSLFSICIVILLIDSYRNKDGNFKKYLCMIPLQKEVFFSCHLPLKKIDWEYHLSNLPLFWFPLRFDA